MAMLRELAAWREIEARQRDWPRGHVLPDEVLVGIAREAPMNRPALVRVPGLPHNLPEEIMATLLTTVARGLAVPAAECPQPIRDDVSSRRLIKAQSDRLLAHIAAVCATYAIHPALVATRGEADSFVRQLAAGSVVDHPLAVGWRKPFIAGEVEQAFLNLNAISKDIRQPFGQAGLDGNIPQLNSRKARLPPDTTSPSPVGPGQRKVHQSASIRDWHAWRTT